MVEAKTKAHPNRADDTMTRLVNGLAVNFP